MPRALHPWMFSPLLTLLSLSACDPASPEDAGPGADAGSLDAGVSDAGAPLDAGSLDDAGPGTDSGPSPDAGSFDPDALEGYGATTLGGAGGETCAVTTLADDGAGSFRDCVENRNGSGETVTPRLVVFEVGGVITLSSDVRIRQPFLTIDGSTAPSPGVTIDKVNFTDGEVIIQDSNQGTAHDVIVRYLRFDGGWPRQSEEHGQNTGTIAIDGENTGAGVHHVVLDHLVITNATDSGGDMWGDVRDVTVSWCMFLHNLHPMTISHSGTTQARDRISLHHNVYAYNHERNPQIRGLVRDLDYVNNALLDWKRFGGGYGVRVRERNGTVPTRVTFRNNFFSSAMAPEAAILFDPVDYPGDVFASGNVFDALTDAQASTVSAPFDGPPAREVTTFEASELGASMLPFVGMPERTAEEQEVIDTLLARMAE